VYFGKFSCGRSSTRVYALIIPGEVSEKYAFVYCE
jgi:hypothetical protein